MMMIGMTTMTLGLKIIMVRVMMIMMTKTAMAILPA